LSVGKAFVPKAGSGQIPAEEQITLEPELEEALRNATDAEMCDIAGGHHTHYGSVPVVSIHMT